jgi:lambda repressor-like predicted transcriptional regulator
MTVRPFGERIKAAMDERGWTVKKLAVESGVSASLIYRVIHSPGCGMQSKNSDALCQALGLLERAETEQGAA